MAKWSVQQQVRPLHLLNDDDHGRIGGKAANLGVLIRQGCNVPAGFVVTAAAYETFLEDTGLRANLEKFVAALNLEDPRALHFVAGRIRQIIVATPWPLRLKRVILDAYYHETSSNGYEEPVVAVRSSALDEDSAEASFAGQHATYLGVSGAPDLLVAIRRCFASLYEPRALAYRLRQGRPIQGAGIAVVVQVLLDSSISGVMFTQDPNTGEAKTVVEAVFGLGEVLVSGQVTPDRYTVVDGEVDEIFTYSQYRSLTYHPGTKKTRYKDVSFPHAQKLSSLSILELAEVGQQLAAHYGTPQDIEWAINSNGVLYLLQARPITTVEAKAKANLLQIAPIAQGTAAAFGIGTGPVRRVNSVADLATVQPGEVVVTEMTTPDYVPIFDIIAGLVTDLGGATCHAAIVSREFNLPCVVGATHATSLTEGQVVTVDGSNGVVYPGDLRAQLQES